MKWEKDSVMWNWVRVKYDSVWPAPTPNIRCLFFVHHIHSPLPTTTTPRHPRLWLVILLPYYDYYYYYYPTSSPTITTTNTPRHLPVPLIYSSSPSSMTRHPHPQLHLQSSTSTYFTCSPPYFLLPPATYPLQQLLVPVHRPYSFTLPPTPSSWLLQLPSSFYQFSFFDNYQLQYQWLQPLPAPVPVTTTSISSGTSDDNLYQLQYQRLRPLPAPAQTFSDPSSVTIEDRKRRRKKLVSTWYVPIIPCKHEMSQSYLTRLYLKHDHIIPRAWKPYNASGSIVLSLANLNRSRHSVKNAILNHSPGRNLVT